MRNHLLAAAVTTAAFSLLPATGASAATWTEIPSGTAEDITAVEYQGATRLWFATANGKIFRRVGGAFQQEASYPGVVFRDIEFQDGGNIGLAVGTNGTVARSNDAGDTWTLVTLPVGGRSIDENRCDLADQPAGDLETVRFTAPSRAWVLGGGTQIYRTKATATPSDVGGATAGWEYTNDAGATCNVTSDVDDLFGVPGTNSVYFTAKSFGKMFFTSNALDSAASVKAGDGGNGFQQIRRMTGDPVNPNRMWTVTPDGTGGSYYARTTDGWTTSSNWALANPAAGGFTKAESVDYNGGTVLAAGSAGMIVESIDGENFFVDPAGGALATTPWKAVGLAGPADGVVGGAGGKLVISGNASMIPDIIAPAGTITGPPTVTAGQPAPFTANVADNAGGSGVNPASFAWSAPGIPGAVGNPASITFPSPGFYTLKVTFADNAGNTGSATLSVTVRAGSSTTTFPPGTPNPTPTKTVSVAGGKVTLSGPRTCVGVGRTFTATLSFKKQRRKGATFVKVFRVDFFIDNKRVKIDRKAPFRQRLSVRSYKANSTHRLKARAYIKVRRGKSPKKSISTSFQVCSS